MTDEEIEKQTTGFAEGFDEGVRYGMKEICKKILEEVDKDIFIGDGTNIRLRKIIKNLGVDL